MTRGTGLVVTVNLIEEPVVGVLQLHRELGVALLDGATYELFDSSASLSIQRRKWRFHFAAEGVEAATAVRGCFGCRESHASHISRTCSAWSWSVDCGILGDFNGIHRLVFFT
jgi:hypothetical protein